MAEQSVGGNKRRADKRDIKEKLKGKSAIIFILIAKRIIEELEKEMEIEEEKYKFN